MKKRNTYLGILLMVAVLCFFFSCSKKDNTIYADVYSEYGYLTYNNIDSVCNIVGYERITFDVEGIDTLIIITWSKFETEINVYRGDVLLVNRKPELYFNDTIRIMLK